MAKRRHSGKQLQRTPPRGKRVQEQVRAITLDALTRARFDRKALHKLTREAIDAERSSRDDLEKTRGDLRELQRAFLDTLRDAAHAGRGTAAASGAMLANIVAGVLAGIAEAAQKRAAPLR